MFAQVEATMAKSRGGLGIGLSLVRHLVELHGGNVDAVSPGLGQGSTFTVTLPLPEDSSTQPVVPQPAAALPPGPPLRILVVEDHRDGAETLTQLLSCMGHEVRAVFDGGAALPVATEFRPQLVLLDLGLPTLDGYQVCRLLRAQPWGADIVMVAMTGWGDPEAQRQVRAAGFDRHLVKPVDEADLLAALDVSRSAIQTS
jgi:CheY-like chemotaxis protein